MQVFLSHATADRELVVRFSELLILGAGLSNSEVFYSSRKGDIPNGAFFVQHILERLNKSDLVIGILSPAYFKSRFCLAEAGAALARQVAGAAKFYSIVVPPTSFSDLDGVLYGLQSGSILDAQVLHELRDIITAQHPNAATGPIWEGKQTDFLKAADALIRESADAESIRQIKLDEVFVQRDDAPEIVYKSKLRIVMQNQTGRKVTVGPLLWIPSPFSVPLQKVITPLPVQIYQDKKWSGEANQIEVLPEQRFRTWIGLSQTVTDKDLFRHSAVRQLGRLSMTVAGKQAVEVNFEM